jgi:hypothetical protein
MIDVKTESEQHDLVHTKTIAARKPIKDIAMPARIPKPQICSI